MQKIEKWDDVNGRDSSVKYLEQFLNSSQDMYAIFQLQWAAPVEERYASYAALQRRGREPDIRYYDVLYAAELPADSRDLPQDVLLEEIFQQFNLDHPEDFHGHSLSVSDIVALRQDGAVSCHYVDSIGFKELPSFLQPENYLKNAEMALEDDYGMIDGVLNNGRSAAIEQPASVLEQLKQELPSTENAQKLRRPKEKERE